MSKIKPGDVLALVAELPHEDVVDICVDDWRFQRLQDQRHTRVTQAKSDMDGDSVRRNIKLKESNCIPFTVRKQVIQSLVALLDSAMCV
jgi:hypothetical protein